MKIEPGKPSETWPPEWAKADKFTREFCAVENGYPWACVDFAQQSHGEHAETASVFFRAWNVNTWSEDGEPNVDEMELICDGFVKWDGCSHLTWHQGGKGDTMMHLCGAHSWDVLSKVLRVIWNRARELSGHDYIRENEGALP